MTGDVGALGTVVAGVALEHVAVLMDNPDVVMCLCGHRASGGYYLTPEEHAAHVAAEILRALGVETRVEWGVRWDAPTTDAEAPLREGHIYDQIGDKWDALRIAEAEPRYTPVSRTVTSFRHVGAWAEVASAEGDV